MTQKPPQKPKINGIARLIFTLKSTMDIPKNSSKCAFTVVLVIFLLFSTSRFVLSNSIRERVEEALTAYNQDLPEELGGGIRLLSVTLADKPVLYDGNEKGAVIWVYDYKLNDPYTEKKKVAELERISRTVSVCGSQLGSSVINNGYVLKYQFKEFKGPVLKEFLVGYNECDLYSVIDRKIDKFEATWNKEHKEILPVRLDELTELVSISSKNGILMYITRLPKFSRKDLNSSAPTVLSEHALNSFCQSPDMNFLLSSQFSIKSVFLDRDSKEIVQIIISQSDCE